MKSCVSRDILALWDMFILRSVSTHLLDAVSMIPAKMTSQSWCDLINPAKAVNRDDIFTKIHVHCEHGTLFTDGKYKGFL